MAHNDLRQTIRHYQEVGREQAVEEEEEEGIGSKLNQIFVHRLNLVKTPAFEELMN